MDPRGCLLMSCLFAGTAAVAQQASNPLDDLLKMQMNWDESRSNDSAAAAITLKFYSYEQHKDDGKSFTSYYLYAPGLKADQPYTLIRWQIGWDAKQPPMQPVEGDLYVNARGVVMCRKPSDEEMHKAAPDIDEDARLNVIAAGAPGEPMRYALYSEKEAVVAMGRLIVNRFQADDKTCHVEAIRAMGGAEIVLVEGTGFTPKTTVELSRQTSGKPTTAKFKTDENGWLETVAILMEQGETHGTASITMKSDACAPSVSVQWGKETYQVQ